MAKKLYSRHAPKELWVIFDFLDGAHLFASESAAKRQLKSWENEAESPFDSVWEMAGPYKYEKSNN